MELKSNSGGLNSYLQLGLYTTTKSLRAFASMRAMNTMLIARSRKSLESVDSVLVEIRKGRNNVGRGLCGYDSQKRKHSQHSDSFKGAFRTIKSGVV